MSRYGYLEVFQTDPLDFEITRVDCISNESGHSISYKTACAPSEDSAYQSFRSSFEDALDPLLRT